MKRVERRLLIKEPATLTTTVKIDILLISETHFTEHSYFKLRGYYTYNTNYPNNTARGGSAILIKHHIKHHEIPKYCSEYIQATSVTVEDWAGPLNISAAYCPSLHRPNKESLDEYLQSLGNSFLAGGDFNAKHLHWGSRIPSPRGRILLSIMQQNHFSHLSTYQPTYWPTNLRKIPNLLDFFLYYNLTSLF